MKPVDGVCGAVHLGGQIVAQVLKALAQGGQLRVLLDGVRRQLDAAALRGRGEAGIGGAVQVGADFGGAEALVGGGHLHHGAAGVRDVIFRLRDEKLGGNQAQLLLLGVSAQPVHRLLRELGEAAELLEVGPVQFGRRF